MEEPEPPPPPDCVYEDGDLLILVKPAGLLCVPGRGPLKQDALSQRAQQAWPGALIVHRLDQATSGLVLMARHPEAQRLLGSAFARREVHKRYETVVYGRLIGTCSSGAWQAIHLPLAADWPQRPRQKVDLHNGKPSTTLWQSIAYDEMRDRTRLALQPLTGRTHQLRLHLAHIGHPIVGDTLYAGDNAALDSPRLLLHACSLALRHPGTGAWLRCNSPVPF